MTGISNTMQRNDVKSRSHGNNFNFLRLLFAGLVIVSHSFALLGQTEPVILGRTLGNLSVHGFFVISGYLICQSYTRAPGMLSFSANRFLRIVPGLIVALVVSKVAADLCGGFKSNPVPYISNGPIWTLTWEVVCYSGLALLGVLGVLRSTTLPGFFAATWLVYLANIANISDPYLAIAPLAMMFLSGAFISVMEESIDFRSGAVMGLLSLLLIADMSLFQHVSGFVRINIPFLWGPSLTDEQVTRVIYLLAFPLVVIFVGKHVKPAIRLDNDISYGMYIYGWPVAQLIIHMAMKHGWAMTSQLFLAATMLVTIPLAFISWRVIERPALSMKRWFVVSNGFRSNLYAAPAGENSQGKQP